MKTFRQVVADALVDVRDEGVLRADQNLATLRTGLALHLKARLEEEGYRIHAVGGCVRVPPSARELGREATTEERIVMARMLEAEKGFRSRRRGR